MIGIVVVSHSPALADAAVALAGEMVPDGEGPVVRVAAGTPDGSIGTDALAVSEAIAQASSPDGVLVLMDLGSAVLSAEMALELADPGVEVRLSPAPFVEGLVAAVVSAAGGADLDRVANEIQGALAPKQSQLGEPGSPAPEKPGPEPAEQSSGVPGGGSPGADATRTLTVVNPLGIHARPAATIAALAADHDAALSMTNRTRGVGPVDAESTLGLLTLGTRLGDELMIEATGPQAQVVVEAVAALIREGFGEV